MSSWRKDFTVAGLSLSIESDVGDPTPHLPRTFRDFVRSPCPRGVEDLCKAREEEYEQKDAAAGPLGPVLLSSRGTSPDLTVLLYEDEEAHADPLRRFFPPRFVLARRGTAFAFCAVAGVGSGEGGGGAPPGRGGLKPLGEIGEGGSGRMGLPPLDRAWRIPEEEEAVREALQGFVKACLQVKLLASGGTMVHGAGISFEDAGFLLTGHTRTGKTTLSRQFPRDCVLGDDLVAVRDEGGGFLLYGTPWPGKEGGAVAYGGIPMRAVFLLHPELPRGLRRRGPGDALAELSANAPRLGHPAEESKLLEIFSSMVEKVPIYEFSLELGDDAVPFFERVLSENGEV